MKRVTLPEKAYAGYIFDLDGTLVDSMPVHYRAWRQALEEGGAPFEAFLPDEFYSYGGTAAVDVVAMINKKYGVHLSPQATAQRKREIYMKLVDEYGVAPIKETIDFVHSLGVDAPIAIATGSAMPGAIHTLMRAGLDDLFPLIITPDEVERGKPFPDMFLLAAQLLHAQPNECIVFEDAVPGIQAAKAAGMDCVVVQTPPEYLRGSLSI
ncbi:MAG: HAD-IA family hydrolase [Akkermansia sp.]